ncbi:MAG: 50S ribosomal protein L30e [Thermoplasmatota archaeon]|jgi:large subunit ribosomal protein L30e
MVDVDKVLKNVVKKGKVKIGARQTQIAIRDGKARLVVIAKNCPFSSDISKMADEKKIPVYNYGSSSVDLGAACGKTFAVSVFAVLDDGGSHIMQLFEKK